ETFAHDHDFGLQRFHEIEGTLHVDMPAVRGKGKVHDVPGVFSHRARAVMTDVAACRGRIDHDHVPRTYVSAEDSVVGDCSADGAHVGLPAAEQPLHLL